MATGSSPDLGDVRCSACTYRRSVTESSTLALALLVLGWAIVSGALARYNLTGPLVFAVAGYLLANPDWGPLDIHVDAPSVHVVAEVTLALVLFSDASRVNVTELRHDAWLPARLLAIGLPLSIVLGSLLAAVFFDVPWALAGFIGAALAPTDAALSAQVIDDERIPLRLRRVLNVESGLNDGIATPIVTFMLAVAASQIGVDRHSASYDAGQALRELGGGVAVGLVVGFAGAALLVIASRHRWIAPGGHRLATLAVAIASLGAALAIDSNGFIAAFVAGITFGAWLNRNEHAPKEVGELPALGGELLALVVWFLFGATLVHVAFDVLDVPLVVYAVASLTIIRALPVALCLVRAGLDRPSVAFIAWFGPRGLASIVFALLAVEELGHTSPAVQTAVAAVSLTVLLSVVLHGVSAGPFGRRYVQIEDRRAKS